MGNGLISLLKLRRISGLLGLFQGLLPLVLLMRE